MSLSITLPDGYTATKTIPAAPGLHPDVVISYRPCLGRVRTEHQFAAQQGADKVSAFEDALIVRQRVNINGETFDTAAKASTLRPALRAKLLDLLLGYAGEDERADAGNSPGA